MIVAPDYTAWTKLFPEFLPTITLPMYTLYFGAACMMVDNTDCSRIQAGAPLFQRDNILAMTTAHVAKILGGSNGAPASGLVGRISDATEGTVSVSAEWASQVSAQSAWWLQTPYGAMAWQALAPFRTMVYVPPPRGTNPAAAGFGPLYPGWGYR